MASTHVSMSMGKLMKNTTMTVTLTGTKSFAVRQWIAIKLMQLAALVLGCGVVVDLKQR